MKMKRVLTPLAIVVSTMMGAQQAAAGFLSESDMIVRVGASWADPDSDNVRFAKDTILLFGEKTKVESDTTWDISAAWVPVEHWGIELMYVGSADNDIDIKGTLFNEKFRERFASFKARAANAYVNWYPLDESCLFQPYLGIGVNYTYFHDASFSNPVKEVLVDSRLGLRHSWGATGQLGVDYRFGRDNTFLVNAAVLYIDSKTDLSASYRDYLDFKYSPWVFNLGVGYAF